jgi:hypothetical protein
MDRRTMGLMMLPVLVKKTPGVFFGGKSAFLTPPGVFFM